ncbi:MAG TPA: PPOX class F420-dependent oxidoreductase [Acidimicrobiia bacterium]
MGHQIIGHLNAGSQENVDAFDHLRDHRFIALTTFRRDGTPVPTTVWFAHRDIGIVFGSAMGAGKVTRLRRDDRAIVAASTFRGRLKGEPTPAVGSILDEAEVDKSVRLLAAKYGVAWRLFGGNMDVFVLLEPT